MTKVVIIFTENLRQMSSVLSKTSVDESANRFGFELFKVFHSRHKNEYKNISFSPLTVFNSLAMILIAAENQSQTQLASVLHLSDIKKDKTVLERLKELSRDLIESNQDIILAIRFLYINKGIELKEDYKTILKEYFEVKAKKMDFSDVEESVKTINEDSKRSTDGIIDEVIEKKDISGENKNVKLILTNSLFFRGFWSAKFEGEFKEKFTFGKNNQQTADIHMIRHLGLLRHIDFQPLKAHIVSIPYSSNELRMIVILPDDPKSDGHYLIEYLNKHLFETIMNELYGRDGSPIDLMIPEFGLDAQKMSVQRTIKQMGAINIFEESVADLKGMSESPVFLTKLVHKAFILVDERGSAEGDPRIRKTKDVKPFVFKANHPFVFLIADKKTKVVLFMSYIGDPREMLEVVKEKDLTQEQIFELLANSESYD